MPTAGFEQCADVGRHLCLVFLSGPNLFFLTFKGCIAIRFQVFQNTLFCWIFELLLAATPCFRWFHACWDWWYRWCLDPSSLLQRQRTGKNWFGSLGPRMEKMWWQERFGSSRPRSQLFRRIHVNDSVHMQSFWGVSSTGIIQISLANAPRFAHSYHRHRWQAKQHCRTDLKPCTFIFMWHQVQVSALSSFLQHIIAIRLSPNQIAAACSFCVLSSWPSSAKFIVDRILGDPSHERW